jgi:hypothetical protein
MLCDDLPPPHARPPARIAIDSCIAAPLADKSRAFAAILRHKPDTFAIDTAQPALRHKGINMRTFSSKPLTLRNNGMTTTIAKAATNLVVGTTDAVVPTTNTIGFTTATVAAAMMFVVAATTPIAQAQWTVTNLHPAGATASMCNRTDGQMQVGSAEVGGITRASVWTGSSPTWRDLHPAGATSSTLLNLADGRGQGWAVVGGVQSAHVWTLASGAATNLHPAGSSRSEAFVGLGDAQAGYANFPGRTRAGEWIGDRATWLPYLIAGPYSVVLAMTPFQRGGILLGGERYRATIWNIGGTSRIDLHPPQASTSVVVAIDSGQQAGYATIDFQDVACMWQGTAASFTSLHPAAASRSQIADAYGGYQVGFMTVDPMDKAAMWSGTAASVVDLHALLPAGTGASRATGVWHDGRTLTICGYALDLATNANQAWLWTRAIVCDDLDFDNDGMPASDADALAFLAGLAGADCPTCNDVDFNNNGVFPEDQDVIDFFNVLAGGTCP